jgi:DNA-binding NarL/FixJ family response regulator
MEKPAIRVGVVDGHNLFRRTLCDFLSNADGMQVVMDARGNKELFEKLASCLYVDVLLLDFFVPCSDGKEVLSILQTDYPLIKVIILSMCHDPEIISGLFDYGIFGYITKSADTSELLEAIRGVASGVLFQNKILAEVSAWRKNALKKGSFKINRQLFNDKQKRLIQLLWQEKSTQEIADELFLSVSSVDKIKQQLKEKIGAKSTMGVIKYGIEKRIICL